MSQAGSDDDAVVAVRRGFAGPRVDTFEQESVDDTDEVVPAVEAEQVDSLVIEEQHKGRQSFENRWYFVLVCVGFAVGLGNVTRFPYLLYRNGGGAFLIPYCVALAVAAWPLACLEVLVGQLYREGPVRLFQRVLPAPLLLADGRLSTALRRFGGVGLAAIVTSAMISMYYVTLLGWSTVYFVHSFLALPDVPWRHNANYFFDEVLAASPSMADVSSLNVPVFLAVTANMLFVLFSVFNGVQGSSKVAIVTVGMPYLTILVLLVRGLTLDGAATGVRFYLYPDFSKLLELRVWIDAAVQIFFSLSPCWGVLVTFGSYLKPTEDVLPLSLTIAAVNSLTSFVAGFAIFAILGHLSLVSGVPIDQVVAGGPELAYVVYPAALATMPASWFFAAAFFAMLIMLGIDSLFSAVEAIIAAVEDSAWMQRHRVKRGWVVTGTVAVLWLGSLVFCTDAGLYFVAAADNYVPMLSLFVVAIGQLLCIAWAHDIETLFADVVRLRAKPWPVQWLFRLFWKFGTLVFPTLLLSFAVVAEIMDPAIPDLPLPARVVGWIVALLPSAIIVWYAIYPAKESLQSNELCTTNL